MTAVKNSATRQKIADLRVLDGAIEKTDLPASATTSRPFPVLEALMVREEGLFLITVSDEKRTLGTVFTAAVQAEQGMVMVVTPEQESALNLLKKNYDLQKHGDPLLGELATYRVNTDPKERKELSRMFSGSPEQTPGIHPSPA